MQRNKYWYKLDNAGKIFPATSNKKRSNVFRISFYLKENINKDILKEALDLTLNRIIYFKTDIRNGLFWNYFSENKNEFLIDEETEIVCRHFKFKDNQGYLFKLYYFNNKISLETFHALTDGTGALEFLKSVVYEYLTLLGNIIPHENKILSKKPFSNKEITDSFLSNYNKDLKKVLKEEKAYHLSGERFKNNFTLVFTITTNTKTLLKNIKEKYNATLTEYLTALITYSILDEGLNVSEQNKPVKMFIPVNLRPYFNSSTIKNFALYIKTTTPANSTLTLDELIKQTKIDFNKQLNKDDLQMRLSSLVSIEKNSFIKYVPLFIKNIFFKIGYNMLGDKIITSSLSNLGKVDLPKEMLEFVENVDFINGGGELTTTVLSLEDKLNITFHTSLKDLSVIKSFVGSLKEITNDITITTNYKESYYEKV